MAQAQDNARPSLEEAEGAIARGMAELPEVAAAYCTAEGGVLHVTVLHDHASMEDGFSHVVCKMADVEEEMPRLDIRPTVIPASRVPAGAMRWERRIYKGGRGMRQSSIA